MKIFQAHVGIASQRRRATTFTDGLKLHTPLASENEGDDKHQCTGFKSLLIDVKNAIAVALNHSPARAGAQREDRTSPTPRNCVHSHRESVGFAKEFRSRHFSTCEFVIAGSQD
jgi:hypothetical protein